ncbi:Zinc finger protein 568-like 1 [Homarus americanus]|uniref:Zinc finger protein 568-like 1 n=1 Tax=Homarus americanus TaxID=6706 RepID=A0A8J5JZJ0_HOMAM|nr:Zinc finger protein 568-like 1 [Homarus americanus]
MACFAVMTLACPVCGKSFGGRNRKQNLGFHMMIHTGEKRHQCPYCPHKSTLKYNLIKHIRNIHSDLYPQNYNFPCQRTEKNIWEGGRWPSGPDVSLLQQGVCGAQPTPATAVSHSYPHRREAPRLPVLPSSSQTQAVPPVVCPVCGKSVSGINGKQKLRYHMLTHTGERLFQCPYCPHRAGLKFNLNRHMRTVHKDCIMQSAQDCIMQSAQAYMGSKTIGNSSLAVMGVPSDERLLVCEVCGKEFRGRNLRQRRESHLLTHSGLRPHICPHCPHRTALRSNLIKHIRAIHRVSPSPTNIHETGVMGSVVGEEIREYLTCPVCGRCITGKNCRQNLRHHLLIHTGEKPYPCPHCPHRANYKPNLLKHIRSVHGAALVSPLGMSGCEEKVVQCGVCGKVFSGRSRKHNLKQHILTHTGERPHLCAHCPYRSSHRPTLRRHILTVHAHLVQQSAPLPSNPPTFSYTR